MGAMRKLLLFYSLQLFQLIYSSSQPNIIFILADDLGYDDVGFQSSNQIHTPNIDKLHSDGQFLEFYYGQPVCSPTRTAIMTGKYPLHNSINTIIQPGQAYGVPLSNILFPQILLENGYATHVIGKWHMGFYKWAYTPTFRGFQSFYGYYTGAEDYFTHVRSNYFDFRDDNGINCGANCSRVASEAKGTYSAFAFTTRAIEIIRNHNKTEPLFLYLPFQSVHEPNQVPNQYKIPYNTSISNKKRRTFAGMLSCLDEGIGNITNVLTELGYLDDNDGNTLIIFSSDNGGPVPNVTGSANIPLRGGKGSIWEGGVRLTASIFGTADIIPKGLRGTNYTQLMHVVDWYPTLLSAAGIDMNDTLDGVNHWDGISGKDVNDDKYFKYRSWIYHGYRDTGGPWTGYNNTGFRYEWNKLINGTAGVHNSWYPPPELNTNSSIFYYYDIYNKSFNATQPVHIFNIGTDPYEYTDIVGNNASLLQFLWNMMITIESSGIPQASPDKNCPKITHPNDSIVGGVWAPWCG